MEGKEAEDVLAFSHVDLEKLRHGIPIKDRGEETHVFIGPCPLTFNA